MNWRIELAVETDEPQRSVANSADITGVQMLTQGCGINSKTHEMIDISESNLDHMLPQKIIAAIFC